MRIIDIPGHVRAVLQVHGRTMRTETLSLLASLFFTVACNGPFWSALTAQKSMFSAETSYLLFFTGMLITGLQWFLLLLLINRWTAKPLLFLLLCLNAPLVYFMSRYGVYFDMAMVRNIVETDVREASELFDWAVLPYGLGYIFAPGLLLYSVTIENTSLREAFAVRGASILAASVMVAMGLWPVMNQLVPTFREHKELRYLVTPSNFVISSVRLMMGHSAPKAGSPLKRNIIAADAHRDALRNGRKPQAIVLVIGETMRAANWGLNGYARQTTPELASRGLLNFRSVRSCGTDTATSVPCMFSLYGRAHYDEDKIRASESVLHVLKRVGVEVLWRDNQSGCKGVCDGLPMEDVSKATEPSLCNGKRCFDAILLQGLKEKVASSKGDTLIVLHMLGNHGPAYYDRYPLGFRHFTPTCDKIDLAECSHDALINTYDNAVLYTDHMLAALIDELQGIPTHDTAMLYVSDHGESLGEKNLYLHGMPYAIAPDEQTHVPMVIWLSPTLAESLRLDHSCGSQNEAVSHDNLFHTLLGLFNVRTQAYDATMDLMKRCKK